MRTIFFVIFSAYLLLAVIAVSLPRVLPCEAGEISTWITCDISLSTSPQTGTPSSESEELSPQLEKRSNQHQRKADAARMAAKKQELIDRIKPKPEKLPLYNRLTSPPVGDKKPNPPHLLPGGVGYTELHNIPDLPEHPNNKQEARKHAVINLGKNIPGTGYMQVAPVSLSIVKPNMNVNHLAPSAGLTKGHVYIGNPVHVHESAIVPDRHGRKANAEDVRRINEGEVVEFRYGASD